MIDYIFNKITKLWVASSGVQFMSGKTTSYEPYDAYSYKLRGLYLNGTDRLLTLDTATNFYLHAIMTIETWIRPETEAGSIFSKSYNDYAVAGASDFFDL